MDCASARKKYVRIYYPMAKVTRIAFSKNLNAAKYEALCEQARRLGQIRSEVWQRYGSVAGIDLDARKVRDHWLRGGRVFDVLANAWKETLRDAMDDIRMHREAAKRKVRQAIRRRASDDKERKRLYILLKNDRWTGDSYLRRMMRKYWRRGHNHTHNQIVVRADNYTVFQLGGRTWIKIPGLLPRERVAIPLNTSVAPTGALRLILREGRVEIHYVIDVKQKDDCGDATIGVDKGFTEVMVDSDGEHYGESLGTQLAVESDFLN